MAARLTDPKNTNVQKLSELVEWFISDRSIELKFTRNELNKGTLAPEFNFIYLYENRRVTERCLAMLIMTELARRNYNYQLSKIIGTLTEFSWRHYMAHQQYPASMQSDTPKIRKPVGRPRKEPKRLQYTPQVSVNTSKENTDV